MGLDHSICIIWDKNTPTHTAARHTQQAMTRKLNIDNTYSDTVDRRPAGNSTFAIGGVLCSADSFEVKGSSVLRTNICGENPAHRKSANRYRKRPTEKKVPIKV